MTSPWLERPHPSLTRDQTEEGETPEAMYAAFRYLDRLFSAPPHKNRGPEIAALDVERLSPRVRYLAWHLLVLQKRANLDRLRLLLEENPNLRPLARERYTTLDHEIVLQDPPLDAWAYLKKNGIRL